MGLGRFAVVYHGLRENPHGLGPHARRGDLRSSVPFKKTGLRFISRTLTSPSHCAILIPSYTESGEMMAYTLAGIGMLLLPLGLTIAGIGYFIQGNIIGGGIFSWLGLPGLALVLVLFAFLGPF